MTIQPTYLGDGVYASYDGYNVNLTTGDHHNPTRVALEPEVVNRLIDYRNHIDNVNKESRS